jgi:DNA repair protein RecN (Recombination protein N)
MLTELRIENFAIIERLEVRFEDGLITFTGETGAGKSIIIDAVETLLGGRAEAVQVRTGADRANVEAVFRIPATSRQAIHSILEGEDLLDDPNYLTLGREIRIIGRNTARVNGRLVNAGLLRDLGEYLVDVHGQSEHLSLLRVHQHIGLLDRYASSDPQNPIESHLESYHKDFHRLQAVQRELEDIQQAERDAARRADMLNYQIQEIETARLHSGEEETLREERDRLANAEELASLVQQALLALDEGTPQEPAATDLLGRVTEALESLADLDPSQAKLHESMQSLFESLSDLARELRLYHESIEFNPRRLDLVEERLGLIQSLKRKYGESIPKILAFAADAHRKLDEITHAAERLEALDGERRDLLLRLGEQGEAISQCRLDAAKKLENAIEAELADLHMAAARFKVDFQQQDEKDGVPIKNGRKVAYHANGLERIEFLIAPNPGEGFKPLTKIASGGETSRLMLALKNVLVKADHVPTLIFDEIDQGIGGRVGGIVGEKLWRLARQHQVLCITHLPQLAAFGEQHFHVEKQILEGRTTTHLKLLDDQDRLVELAQMLGSLSEGTLHSARELMQMVDNQRARA